MVLGLESLIQAVQRIPCITVSSMKANAATVNSQFCSVSWTSMKRRMCGGTQIDRIWNRFTSHLLLILVNLSNVTRHKQRKHLKISWFFSGAYYFCRSQSVSKKQNYRCGRWWVFHSTDNSMVHCLYAIRTTFSRSNSFFFSFVSSIFRFRVHTILLVASVRSVESHPIYVGFKLESEEEKKALSKRKIAFNN